MKRPNALTVLANTKPEFYRMLKVKILAISAGTSPRQKRKVRIKVRTRAECQISALLFWSFKTENEIRRAAANAAKFNNPVAMREKNDIIELLINEGAKGEC